MRTRPQSWLSNGCTDIPSRAKLNLPLPGRASLSSWILAGSIGLPLSSHVQATYLFTDLPHPTVPNWW